MQQALDDQTADEILARRFVATGDEAAFELLVRRYSPPLHRLLCAFLGGSREDLEDAEQEIFTALFLGLPSFRFRSSFRTYFYRLARNRAVDCLRRRQSLRARLRRLAAEAASRPDREAGPEAALLASEAGARLLAALGGLRDQERFLIVMKDSEGLSLGEIAAVTGLPEGTVKSRLHRARARLVKRLQEEGR